MLERLEAIGAAFVTLTYSDEKLPKDGFLVKEDVQLWLKRFREKITPLRVRFYLVGEYGSQSGRPHYHIALFGWGPCIYGRSRYGVLYKDCCSVCDTIRDTWGLGHVDVGEVEVKSMMYICGYMLKNWTNPQHPGLKGRPPEFRRMSLRPGIGAWAMDEVASGMLQYDLEKALVDVPESLRHGVKLMGLGRYLRRRLRERIGRDAGCPEEVLVQMAEEMRPVSRIQERYSAVFGQKFVSQSVDRKLLLDAGRQRVRQMIGKQKLQKGSSSL